MVKNSDFDGTTLIELAQDDFTFTPTTRLYEAAITTGGLINSDYFGFLSIETPKIVGVASWSENPRSVVRVVSGTTAEYREEVELSPRVQYVVMNPRDQLSIRTESAVAAGGRVAIDLVVNDLGEQNHIELARQNSRGPVRHTRRYRVVRADAGAFSPSVTPLDLTYTFDETTRLLNGTVPAGGSGQFKIQALRNTRFEGAQVRVRVSGSAGPMELYRVEGRLNEFVTIETGVVNATWSKPFWLGYDDGFTVRTAMPSQGNQVGLDIEILPPEVRPRQL
ncbi:MAG: hypothetical protein KDA28_09200 [Phycisphaerales bacterium]|nr:hypothetical protein [Phycisphaerales bacterium]